MPDRMYAPRRQSAVYPKGSLLRRDDVTIWGGGVTWGKTDVELSSFQPVVEPVEKDPHHLGATGLIEDLVLHAGPQFDRLVGA